MSEKLRTKLIVTRRGKSAGLTQLKLNGAEFRTDESGQIDVTLDIGRTIVHVLRDEEWIPHVVETSRDSQMVILDINAEHTLESFERSLPDTAFVDIGHLNLGERYIFEEVVGRGGMSVVLKAHDRILNRSVAVKLLSEELQHQPEAQEIFLTEARSLATLSHPNLVSVHDICKVDERVFMVIELIDGQNLEKLVTSLKGFNQQLALQTSIQLARVVGYLHDKGVLHRDLKPANAMIRRDGTLKLIDFGLARQFDELFIRGTRVRGTPAYMSPEQILGKPLKPSSDVYQLGVVMFETLTGKLPFREGDIGYAHVHTEAPRADAEKADVDPNFADLIQDCMAKNPEDRPQDGTAVLRRLQAIYQALGGNDEAFLNSVGDLSNPNIRHTQDAISRLSHTTNSQVGIVASEDLNMDGAEDIAVEGSTTSIAVPVGIGVVLAVIIGAAVFWALTRDESTYEPPVADLTHTVASDRVDPAPTPIPTLAEVQDEKELVQASVAAAERQAAQQVVEPPREPVVEPPREPVVEPVAVRAPARAVKKKAPARKAAPAPTRVKDDSVAEPVMTEQAEQPEQNPVEKKEAELQKKDVEPHKAESPFLDMSGKGAKPAKKKENEGFLPMK